MKRSFEFWDALAPHHSVLENSYLDVPVVRQFLDKIQPPVLVVGAGQGLIVAELQKEGLHCDGVDLSSEMIRHARLRRGHALVQADARAMPFEKGAYKTIIYATGVVDFMSDEAEIRAVMNEGKRIAAQYGIILVAFYRTSASNEKLLVRLGLLNNKVLHYGETLEIHRLNPAQAVAWVARRAKLGYARAALLSLGSWACSTWQEKRIILHMHRIFANLSDADTLLRSAPEELPYRNEAEIRKLFARLAIPVNQLRAFNNCYIVQI